MVDACTARWPTPGSCRRPDRPRGRRRWRPVRRHGGTRRRPHDCRATRGRRNAGATAAGRKPAATTRNATAARPTKRPTLVTAAPVPPIAASRRSTAGRNSGRGADSMAAGKPAVRSSTVSGGPAPPAGPRPERQEDACKRRARRRGAVVFGDHEAGAPSPRGGTRPQAGRQGAEHRSGRAGGCGSTARSQVAAQRPCRIDGDAQVGKGFVSAETELEPHVGGRRGRQRRSTGEHGIEAETRHQSRREERPQTGQQRGERTRRARRPCRDAVPRRGGRHGSRRGQGHQASPRLRTARTTVRTKAAASVTLGIDGYV